jgi:hypothetical protein
MGKDAQGNDVASVSHPALPGGGYRFPLCIDMTPPDCCYDGQRMVLVCPNDPEYDGTPAAVVETFEGPDGEPWVSVAWPGGGARMPLCTEECPPQFCCINVETMMYVCAGELNGTLADVVDVITTPEGFNVAVLADGTHVPTCGRDCPPPQLCPPGCPPGMWMTPDGECVDPPRCPPQTECPPGMWKDPDGICRNPPECPPQVCPPEKCPPQVKPPVGQPPEQCCTPWWKIAGHCCEECALGRACEGDCGCGGGHEKKEANPLGTPVTYPAFPVRGAWVQLDRTGRSGVLHTEPGVRVPVRVLGLRREGGKVYAKIRARATTRNKKKRRAPPSRYRRINRALAL